MTKNHTEEDDVSDNESANGPRAPYSSYQGGADPPPTTPTLNSTMAAPGLGRSPTCLNCLRQLAHPRLAPTTITAAPVSLVQTRHRTTKAELEDLQGIPVRLLEDIPSFGRKGMYGRFLGTYWGEKNEEW